MRRLLPSLIASFAVAGCMVGPDYKRPEVDAPSAFRFEDQSARDLANTAWWEQFQDPVLNRLVKTALAENKDVKIAAARVEEFLGRFGVTRAQLFPQVGAQAQGARQQISTVNAIPLTSNTPNPFNSYALDLGVSWELDLWGKLRRATEAARAELL
ncbi:MAG: TolC family protein, partial [Burkholderiales bacterium]